LNPYSQIQNLLSCLLDDPRGLRPRISGTDRWERIVSDRFARDRLGRLSFQLPMGSLIKKRRKRMRKKKHKKMLKRTRFQRRNK
jgi:hypothetical protein